MLPNGSQGTAFAGVIWHTIDREEHRVVVACDRLKKFGVIRTDLTSELIAMVLMGAWVLTMRKMVSRTEKPDFLAMITELNVVVGEGLIPPAVTKPRQKSSSAPRVPVARRRTPRSVRTRKAP